MLIYGENIVLRGIETRDNSILLDLINDPETENMLGGSSLPVSEIEQLSWFERQVGSKDNIRCIVALSNDSTKAIGTVILSDIDNRNGTAQIHIKMIKDARGKGYGADALNAISAYAIKELRLNCVYAHILTYNVASVHLFEKCGFIRDGILRSRVYKNGKYLDIFSYSLIGSQILN